METNRPRIIITPSSFDKKIDLGALFLFIVMWLITILLYFYLPKTIPIHFNAKGVVDDYGTKATILLLPVIGTIIYFGLTKLNNYPHIFNYPATITPENAEVQYTAATKMIRWLKFTILMIFIYINITIGLTALGKVDGLGWWFLPLTLLLTFGPIIGYGWVLGEKKSK